MATRQRQQTTQTQQGVNQVHPDFASVESEDGVTFSKGNMLVGGTPQVPRTVKSWWSSNGTTQYTTVEWEDSGTGERRVSCNCPGWANKKKGQPRQCAHTKDMMGIGVCNKEAVDARPVQITSVEQAERRIHMFDGKALRGIQL